MWLLLIGLTVSAPSVSSAQTIAEEEGAELVSVHDEEALRRVRRAAIFLAGEDPFQVQVLQDALAIELRELGWSVAAAHDIEDALAASLHAFDATIPDSIRGDPAAIEEWTLGRPVAEGPVADDDEEAIARLVGADAYISGTALLAQHQYVTLSEGFNASAEKIVIASLALQVHSVRPRRILAEIVLGYVNGKSPVYVAQDARAVLERAR